MMPNCNKRWTSADTKYNGAKRGSKLILGEPLRFNNYHDYNVAIFIAHPRVTGNSVKWLMYSYAVVIYQPLPRSSGDRSVSMLSKIIDSVIEELRSFLIIQDFTLMLL